MLIMSNRDNKSEKEPQPFHTKEIDELTGACNKEALKLYGEKAVQESDLKKIPLSLIIFDLDNFKNVNDNHGCSAGDFIIKETAAIIKNTVNKRDCFFARLVAEEFAVTFYSEGSLDAKEAAEKVRKAIAKKTFEYKGNKINLTISAGVSTRQPHGEKWANLFHSADEALFVSKKNGKNQVTIN